MKRTVATLEACEGRGDAWHVESVGGVALVTVSSTGELPVSRLTARVIEVVRDRRLSLYMITHSSGTASVCVAVPYGGVGSFRQALYEHVLAREPRSCIRVTDEGPLTVVSLVIDRTQGVAGTAGRLFAAVARAGVNVSGITQVADERRISFCVIDAARELTEHSISDEFSSGVATLHTGQPVSRGREWEEGAHPGT